MKILLCKNITRCIHELYKPKKAYYNTMRNLLLACCLSVFALGCESKTPPCKPSDNPCNEGKCQPKTEKDGEKTDSKKGCCQKK